MGRLYIVFLLWKCWKYRIFIEETLDIFLKEKSEKKFTYEPSRGKITSMADFKMFRLEKRDKTQLFTA